MPLDALMLSRLQFAFTLAFHIVYPSFSIGLGSFLAVLEGLWLLTRREAFQRLYLFWLRIFAISFGMGVVTGVVMSYQIGTNWAVYSRMTAGVLGPLLAFEVLTAFFLESSFLGVMLLGWKRVGPGLHFAATCLVAFGTLVSAFWILSANSWMQTPTGYGVLPDGRFVATDWWRAIFSPSLPQRFAHMVLAAYLSTALMVGAASAFQLLRAPGQSESKIALRMAIGMYFVVAPLQFFVGDYAGKQLPAEQPAKLAAIEGFWDTKATQDFHIVAWPDRTRQRNDWQVSLPKLGSWITTGDANATLRGLKSFPRADQPPSIVVFWSFRVMVGLGLAMIGLGLWGAWLWWRRALEKTRLFLRATILMGPAGFVAVIAGWITAEVGRQPWVVYGLMRTSAGVSPVTAHEVSTSLIGLLVVYAVIFTGAVLYMLRLMAQGPVPGTSSSEARAPGTAFAAVPGGARAVSLDLPLIWAGVIAFAVLLYVLLDGFDLGVGILFAFAKSPAERDVMMATIAPYWDGNETWLVLGGAGLFAAFPGAYATLLPAFYLPIFLMLLALILRGVAFEFRHHGRRGGKALWTFFFSAGSITAAAAQGLVLGGFMHGVKLAGGQFAGGPFDWATPYSALIALGLICGYALLGAGWLLIKTDGELHGQARRWAGAATALVALLLAAVSLATLVVEPQVGARWGWTGAGFDLPRLARLAPIPLLGAVGLAILVIALRRGSHLWPFVGAVVVFISGYLGLAASFFPYVTPYGLTYVEAANAPSALSLLFGGLVFILPVILGYTIWVYWVFRGKTAADAGYH